MAYRAFVEDRAAIPATSSLTEKRCARCLQSGHTAEVCFYGVENKSRIDGSSTESDYESDDSDKIDASTISVASETDTLGDSDVNAETGRKLMSSPKLSEMIDDFVKRSEHLLNVMETNREDEWRMPSNIC